VGSAEGQSQGTASPSPAPGRAELQSPPSREGGFSRPSGAEDPLLPSRSRSLAGWRFSEGLQRKGGCASGSLPRQGRDARRHAAAARAAKPATVLAGCVRCAAFRGSRDVCEESAEQTGVATQQAEPQRELVLPPSGDTGSCGTPQPRNRYDFSPLVLGIVTLKLEISSTNHQSRLLLNADSFGGSPLLVF